MSGEIAALILQHEKTQAAETPAAPAPETVAAAPASDLPTGAEVLERFITVSGGRDAYAAVHSRVLSGTLEFVGMGIQSKVQAWQAEPFQFYTLRDTEGLGPVEEGCDGDVVWAASLTQGPEVARGALRAFKLRAFRFNADCHWRDLYERVECAGIAEVNRSRCYKIVKYPAAGHPEAAFYEIASGLLLATEVVVPTPMGDIPTQSFYSDYRRVNGLLVPHREVIRTMGREQRMEYSSIAYDVEIPMDRFEPPADIRVLVERYRAKAEGPTQNEY